MWHLDKCLIEDEFSTQQLASSAYKGIIKTTNELDNPPEYPSDGNIELFNSEEGYQIR